MYPSEKHENLNFSLILKHIWKYVQIQGGRRGSDCLLVTPHWFSGHAQECCIVLQSPSIASFKLCKSTWFFHFTDTTTIQAPYSTHNVVNPCSRFLTMRFVPGLGPNTVMYSELIFCFHICTDMYRWVHTYTLTVIRHRKVENKVLEPPPHPQYHSEGEQSPSIFDCIVVNLKDFSLESFVLLM